MAAWIRMISDDEADPALRETLDLARTPHGTVDNVMRVHSLRPNTMRGHVILYRACLHDDANTLPMWLQETVSSYVSILNDCAYSLANHWANARHLIGDDARADAIEAALHARRPEDALDGRELALLRYAEKLTLRPGEMVRGRRRGAARGRRRRRRDSRNQSDRRILQLCEPAPERSRRDDRGRHRGLLREGGRRGLTRRRFMRELGETTWATPRRSRSTRR
jgi:alkylhydroperoxidase family enzyme